MRNRLPTRWDRIGVTTPAAGGEVASSSAGDDESAAINLTDWRCVGGGGGEGQ